MAEPPSLDSSCASLESAEFMEHSVSLLKGNESTAATNGSISSRNSSMSITSTPGAGGAGNSIINMAVNNGGSAGGPSSSCLASSSSVQSTSNSSLNSTGEGPVGMITTSGLPVGGSAANSTSHVAITERMEQENRVLKLEVDTLKMRIKSLIEENKQLRKESVSIQARAEQEEEFISNTLLKQIKALKREKETLALNYEQEEECLTNDLSRQLNQLRAEKAQLEKTLEQEQEALVSKLMKKIEKLESETSQKQQNLEQLRREKIELENKLEAEQESLVNKLWKRMDKLEAEKRCLQEKIEKATEKTNDTPAPPVITHLISDPIRTPSQRDLCNASPASSHASMSCSSTPASSPAGCGLGQGQGPREPPMNSHNLFAGSPNISVTLNSVDMSSADPMTLSLSVSQLKSEVMRLRSQLIFLEKEHVDRMAKLEREEREQREANLRLQRKLQLEMERREQLCRNLSESESSLEMDEERQFNEHGHLPCPRQRTLSSPIPPNMSPGGGSIPIQVTSHGLHHAPHSSLPPLGRPLSPAPVSCMYSCPNCGYNLPPSTSASPIMNLRHTTSKDKFIKPTS